MKEKGCRDERGVDTESGPSPFEEGPQGGAWKDAVAIMH